MTYRPRRTPQIITALSGQKIAPFFTNAFVFSNHFPCHFTVDQMQFSSTEQFYMFMKAAMFGDEEAERAILHSQNAGEIKRMGARIRLFDTSKWRRISLEVMTVANWSKFNQNHELRRQLMEVGRNGVLLVEASPSDRYWGVGVALGNVQALRDMQNWPGKNMMGRILTALCRMFQTKMANDLPQSIVLTDMEFPPLDQAAAAPRAQLLELPLIGKLSLDLVGGEKKESDASAVQSSSSTFVNMSSASASQSVGRDVEPFENEGFGSKDKDSASLVDEFERFGVSEEKGKIVEYVVCQVEESLVVAGRLRQMTNLKFPYFVSISNELVEKSENFLRKLQTGDIVGISRFEWREGYKYLAKRESEKNKWNKMWFVQKINWQASATELCYINYATWREHPGIVLRVRESVSAGISRKLCAIVISSGLQVSSRCYRRQLIDLDLDSLVEGQLVKVWTVSVSEQFLVDSAYILPPQTAYKQGTEKMVDEGRGILASIGQHKPEWPYQQFYPLSPEMSLKEIELAEKVFAAVIAYSFEDEEKKIIDGRFEGMAMFSDELFWLKFVDIDNARMKKLKDIWEVDAQVVLKPAMDANQFASGFVKEIGVESARSLGKPKFVLWVAVRATNVQGVKNIELLEGAKEGDYIVAHPVIPLGLERRRECFAVNLPSRVASLNTNQGKLMRAVMGRSNELFDSDEQESSGSASAEKEFHPLMRRLNEKQKVTAKLLLDDECRLVYQNAPPGVGKTFVASIVAAIMLATMEDIKIAVVTSANLPLAKLAQEMDEILGSSEMEEAGSVAFFSGYAKEKYRVMIERLRRHILVSKLNSEEIQRKLEERTEDKKELQDVREYCKDFEYRPRLTKEKKMASLYSEVADMRIVFVTATMAENMIWTALTDTSALIFDEATQGPWVVLTHLVARLPKLRKIFITGDRYQLGVHLQELPLVLQKGFGLESMVDQLVDSPLVEQTKLVKCYRMHPMLVEAVSYASYEQHGEVLEVGTSAAHRSLLTGSRFPLPMQNCPIVILNIKGTCRQDTQSYSLTNDLHTASAVQLTSALFDNLPGQNVSVVVICLYLFQKECIRREFDDLGLDVLVVSVDEYQAQEADITIVVTTRSSVRVGNIGGTSEFLKDSQRATVAISRAKHGLFLIGDVSVLSAGIVWGRFMERVAELTQIVDRSYIQLLRSGQYRRDRIGQLLDHDYRVVGDWSTTEVSSTQTARHRDDTDNRNETWRDCSHGQKRAATQDIGPAPRRDENWRRFTGATFSRGGGGGGSNNNTCYNCGQRGHWQRDCRAPGPSFRR